MSRPIDADRLKRSFEANTPIAFQDCVPGIHAVIDLEPTVEAIPVKYILNKCPLSFASDSIEYLNEAEIINRFIYSLIHYWRIEQAERKEK